jgi:hypothetical protein
MLNNQMNTLYMVLASIGGASLNFLIWWKHLSALKRARERENAIYVFLIAAMPAPFFAMLARDYINYNYSWTRAYPSLPLCGAFFCGAFSPALYAAAERRLRKTTEKDNV